MIPKKSEEFDEELQAAEDALKAAQAMPGGPERIAALKKASKDCQGNRPGCFRNWHLAGTPRCPT